MCGRRLHFSSWGCNRYGVSLVRFLVLLLFLLQISCSDSAESNDAPKKHQSSLVIRDKVKLLESKIESLRWENARLSLKIRSENGSRMVKDKKTGLWHFDVERIPYTGMVVEKFPDGSPRAEASFLKGRKDGMERFWYKNGILKEESHWFDGLAEGIMSTWTEEGASKRIIKFKKGELIEVLKE